jgi:DNA-binding NarL/FixJ family response regulator
MIHVVLVDDHARVRSELRALLQNHRDVKVVGEAADGLEAIAATERLAPDIVVMDVHMPKMNGIDATIQIKRLWPKTVVICVSADVTTDVAEAISSSGAAVLIAKEDANEKLYPTVISLCSPLGQTA